MFAVGLLAGSAFTFAVLAIFGFWQQEEAKQSYKGQLLITEEELTNIKWECYQKGKEDGRTIGSLPVCKN